MTTDLARPVWADRSSQEPPCETGTANELATLSAGVTGVSVSSGSLRRTMKGAAEPTLVLRRHCGSLASVLASASRQAIREVLKMLAIQRRSKGRREPRARSAEQSELMLVVAVRRLLARTQP